MSLTDGDLENMNVEEKKYFGYMKLKGVSQSFEGNKDAKILRLEHFNYRTSYTKCADKYTKIYGAPVGMPYYVDLVGSICFNDEKTKYLAGTLKISTTGVTPDGESLEDVLFEGTFKGKNEEIKLTKTKGSVSKVKEVDEKLAQYLKEKVIMNILYWKLNPIKDPREHPLAR